MANVDRPFGFRPKDPNAPVHYHNLSASNSAIRRGHPVVKDGNGVIAEATAAGGANSVLGIAAEYKAASTGGNIAVWDDPMTIFLAQEDGDSSTTTVTAEGSNMDFIATHSSNNTVDSGAELDSSSANTTSTLQFRVLRKANLPNNAYGDNCIWECMINAHMYKTETGI